MEKDGERDNVRASARRFEETTPAEKRKRLGQFFTGVPLGKLLAHLAISADTRSVLDPMVGHGDLLDAANEAASERGLTLRHLDGVEIDEDTVKFCSDRVATISGGAPDVSHKVICGSAFDASLLQELSEETYDLTIANPPYVRYQSRTDGEAVRTGLLGVIERKVARSDRAVWRTLAQGYSGLADLSVPAWILAALMVRPEGRLALVVPATWRTRQYGDIVRYLMLRLFHLEYIVEDTQPGWFSDALVRTHLIVARRLRSDEIAKPLTHRTAWASALWLKIRPEAADSRSLVGTAFYEAAPELALAQWLRAGAQSRRPGIDGREFNLGDEWISLRSRTAHRSWFQKLEQDETGLPLFAEVKSSEVSLPEAARDLTDGDSPFVTLDEIGIRIGQGLRTGCNRFFYVDALEAAADGTVRIKASDAFGESALNVPASVLRPVLRRQSEIGFIARGDLPPGRVLDLRRWVLAEDSPAVAEAQVTYEKLHEEIPTTMPDELATFVRRAAAMEFGEEGGKSISELSAVRTNVRPHRRDAATPRFWYMLPDFMPRHQPSAFVARINHGAPWVECNLDEPILVDANFSTFWSTESSWTSFAIKALLNSGWCQLLMESFGTPMGGGALKLEAAHLRQLPLPALENAERAALDSIGRELARHAISSLAEIDAVVLSSLCKGNRGKTINKLAAISSRTETLRRMRQRKAA